ncbi:hypothetical protein HH310_11305 [Actinoplanes sp. TBRC 11911]|uniref:hypothetical protein n=1 Tax=Actinoplanes sp. TBRC 11911 TaxID=2729386 RepID=UPI00145FB2D7|nr:hypothetical protein [Actinoplanes sp. TBRC 11911]NMO51778.1 hypothetical protein [Actinoplanes sp. TBRC 11911]
MAFVVPDACTLPTAERPLRLAEFDSLFASTDLRQHALAKIAKIAKIDRKIADLTAMRGTLTQLVEARCESLTHCTCPDCPIPFSTIGT